MNGDAGKVYLLRVEAGASLLEAGRAREYARLAEVIIHDADVDPRVLEAASGVASIRVNAGEAKAVVIEQAQSGRRVLWLVRGGQPTCESLAEGFKRQGIYCEIVGGDFAEDTRPPLQGKRVVVTRARAQSGGLVETLASLGADVFEFPVIRIEASDEPAPFGSLHEFDWVILTSVNAAQEFFARVKSLDLDAHGYGNVRFCVVGPGTAEVVLKRHLDVDLMPERHVGESLFDALLDREGDLSGRSVLLPRADIAREALPKKLREQGVDVVEWTLYRTMPESDSTGLADELVEYKPDVITITSPSTARNMVELLGKGRFDAIMRRAVLASIGPVTTEAVVELGRPVAIEAKKHSIPGLVDAILKWASGAGTAGLGSDRDSGEGEGEQT